jgi:predicted dienelactone hydrolase
VSLVTLLAAAIFSVAADTGSVGLSSFTAIDAQHGDTIHAAIWYRSTSPPHDTTIALQSLRVAPDGDPSRPSLHRPLIVISHGTGGDEFGHWDIAEALARAGFIVVTIRHPGDNSRDHSGLGTDRYLYGRSSQVKTLLDSVLSDRTWRTRIDASRIGIVGYSVGSLTALELLGGRPDPNRLRGYCDAHPADPLYCTSPLHGHITLTGRYAGPTADHRIRSGVLLAPAWSFLFDRAGLAAVRTPLLIERGSRDQFVVEPDNALHIISLLPVKPATGVIKGATHYSFLAPCGAALARVVPEVCTDPAGFSRPSMHAKLDATIVQFFEKTLPPVRRE